MTATKKPSEKPYFEALGTKFPIVPFDQWKQGDVKLVCAATGVEWWEWQKLAEHGFADQQVLQGFFAVAVQRVRGASHEQVIGFLDELPYAGIKLVVPEGTDAVPPGEAAPTADSETQ